MFLSNIFINDKNSQNLLEEIIKTNQYVSSQIYIKRYFALTWVLSFEKDLQSYHIPSH